MREDILSLLRISGAPVHFSALPRFGSFMPEAGAIALGEAQGRPLSDLLDRTSPQADTSELRRWWVSGLSAWIRGWRDSGRRLLPGAINPENVIIPLLRYREGAVIASVAGWRSCDGTHCLVEGLFDVVRRADTHWEHLTLQPSWVVDAFCDVIGDEEAAALLTAASNVMDGRGEAEEKRTANGIRESLHQRTLRYCPPLAVQNAVDCWRDWAAVYPLLVEERGEYYLHHVLELYRVARFGKAARWFVTRQTVLAALPSHLTRRLDELITRMHIDKTFAATRSIELAELQEQIPAGARREQFLRMVFPASAGSDLQLVRMRVAGKAAVVIEHPTGTNGHHGMMIREPLSAAETGSILSLLLQERLPVPSGENLNYLALIDDTQRVVGGVSYAVDPTSEAELQAVIVEESLRGHGFGRALLDDLAVRLEVTGIRSLRAPHFISPFCIHAGFSPDQKDGELRRVLDVPRAAH